MFYSTFIYKREFNKCQTLVPLIVYNNFGYLGNLISKRYLPRGPPHFRESPESIRGRTAPEERPLGSGRDTTGDLTCVINGGRFTGRTVDPMESEPDVDGRKK